MLFAAFHDTGCAVYGAVVAVVVTVMLLIIGAVVTAVLFRRFRRGRRFSFSLKSHPFFPTLAALVCACTYCFAHDALL